MKHLIIIPILLLLAGTAFAQPEADHEVEADSKIEAVTVFLNQAQVTRQSEVLLRRGRNVVYFRGLSNGLDANSIQFKAPKEVLINTVVAEVNYLNRNGMKPREKVLNDSLELLQGQIKEEQILQGILDNEKNLLLANQSLASEKKGLDLEQLKQAADYFRKRVGEINTGKLKSQRKVKALNLEVKKLRNQLLVINQKRNRSSKDIRVVLSTYSTRKVQLELKYLVSNARWVPRYDLRAKNVLDPIDLEYKADVYQNTGVDWEDVDLTLSTGNPSLQGDQPEMSPWNLYVYNPPVLQEIVVTGDKKRKSARNEPMVTEEAEEDDYEFDEVTGGAPAEFGDATTLADYTTVVEGATTAEFKIGIRQDIPSGNRPEQVSIRKEELPATYRYYAAPKVDCDAFLIAEVTEWDELNLLAGALNIFYEGTFVAESYLDPSNTSDTLLFSLGRDQRIVVERNQMKEFMETKSFGTNKEKTFAYEFKVRNTKSDPINLRLEDQFPISQDKSITVKVEEVSGASQNEKNGKLEWDMTLTPGETKTVKLVYSVKWPKNKVIPGL